MVSLRSVEVGTCTCTCNIVFPVTPSPLGIYPDNEIRAWGKCSMNASNFPGFSLFIDGKPGNESPRKRDCWDDILLEVFDLFHVSLDDFRELLLPFFLNTPGNNWTDKQTDRHVCHS